MKFIPDNKLSQKLIKIRFFQLSSIIEITAEAETLKDQEGRRASIAYISRYLDQSLRHQKTNAKGKMAKCKSCVSKMLCIWFGQGSGSYLSSLYFSIKGLYVVNVIGQFFLMNEFIGSNYTFYGLDLIRHLSSGYSWEESGNFPRVTFCDFEVRKLANAHRYTVQCVLPINMFNEKIFIFMWFWFVFVASLSLSSLFQWITRVGLESSRMHFIRKFLKLRNLIHSSEMKASFDFVHNYLRQDGVFILRLMSQNVGELFTSEVVDRLWRNYKTHLSIDCIDKRKKSSVSNINNLPDDISQALFSNDLTTGYKQRLTMQPIHTSSSSSQSTIKSHPTRKSSKKLKHKSDRNNISLDHLEEDPGEFV